MGTVDGSAIAKTRENGIGSCDKTNIVHPSFPWEWYLYLPLAQKNKVEAGKQGQVHISGQIIATSHDLTPNGGLVREIPLFQGNLGW